MKYGIAAALLLLTSGAVTAQERVVTQPAVQADKTAAQEKVQQAPKAEPRRGTRDWRELRDAQDRRSDALSQGRRHWHDRDCGHVINFVGNGVDPTVQIGVERFYNPLTDYRVYPGLRPAKPPVVQRAPAARGVLGNGRN